ncbi:hypothetical protein BJ944DRAFT_252034 [Cunninghamella echinulata]|nr:hypothetical protein BJ944DRAFT_252034 [Cunninghamella echinulata]
MSNDIQMNDGGTKWTDIPTKDFKDIIDIYLKIENQCGSLKEINYLSNNSINKMPSLIIIANFKNEDSIRKVSSEGFSHNGLVHRGIVNLNNKEDISKLVRVILNQIPMNKDDQDLITKLSKSLAYGKIMQIKKITRLHFSEGEINVLLDCNNKEEGCLPLQRSLYLEAWDEFFPASFIGALPICFHCRQAGHIKRKCPALAHNKCGKCGNNEHTYFKCRSKKIGEEIDEYIQRKQNQQDSTKDINNNRKSINQDTVVVFTIK